MHLVILWWMAIRVSSFSFIQTSSRNISCSSDYMAHLTFLIDLSQDDNEGKHYKFYYRTPFGRYRTWVEEHDCVKVKESLKCVMHCFEDIDDFKEYEFRLTFTNTSTRKKMQASNFLIGGKYKAAPWNLMSKISLCNDTLGVKYFAAYATSDTSITIDLIRYPFDAATELDSKINITLTGRDVRRSHILNTFKQCHIQHQDLCFFKEQKLKPCSKYKVCVHPGHMKCRYVVTPCNTEPSRQYLHWQDILLIIFGIIICILFILLFFDRFTKEHNSRSKVHSFSRIILVNH